MKCSDDWSLLADEIARARDAYLDNIGQKAEGPCKAALEVLFWDNKAGIIEALRAASLIANQNDLLRSQPEPVARPEPVGWKVLQIEIENIIAAGWTDGLLASEIAGNIIVLLATSPPPADSAVREALEVIERTAFSGSEMSDEYMRGNRDAHAVCADIARRALSIKGTGTASGDR